MDVTCLEESRTPTTHAGTGFHATTKRATMFHAWTARADDENDDEAAVPKSLILKTPMGPYTTPICETTTAAHPISRGIPANEPPQRLTQSCTEN